MTKKILNSETKTRKIRRKRNISICSDYIAYSSEISNNQISPWKIICELAEKYEVSPIYIYRAIRSKNIYCDRNNPLCREGIDRFLDSL